MGWVVALHLSVGEGSTCRLHGCGRCTVVLLILLSVVLSFRGGASFGVGGGRVELFCITLCHPVPKCSEARSVSSWLNSTRHPPPPFKIVMIEDDRRTYVMALCRK